MDNDDPGRRDGRAHRWGRGIAAAAAIAGAMAAPTVLAAEVEDVEFASAEQTYSPAGTPGVIEIAVEFDEAVEVAGAPVFDLMVGTERRRMAYASGTGTARLLFEYAVRKGDLDEDGVGYRANALSGGTIRDGDGEAVDRRFRALPRAPGHTVDGVAPRAVSLQVGLAVWDTREGRPTTQRADFLRKLQTSARDTRPRRPLRWRQMHDPIYKNAP